MAADILRHSDFRTFDLRAFRLTAKLSHHIDHFIYACRADWMTTRLQPTARTDWNAAIWCNLAFDGEARRCAAWRKSARFQAQGCHNRKRVVDFKQIDIFGANTSLFIGLTRGKLRRAQMQYCRAIMQCEAVRRATAGDDANRLHGVAAGN